MKILKPLEHTVDPTLPRWKRMFISAPADVSAGIGVTVGLLLTGAMVWFGGDILLSVIIGCGATILTFLTSLTIGAHHSSKHNKRVEREYQDYLQQFDVETLIKNYHSPEQSSDTQAAIEAFLNTHHRGWSMGVVDIDIDIDDCEMKTAHTTTKLNTLQT